MHPAASDTVISNHGAGSGDESSPGHPPREVRRAGRRGNRWECLSPAADTASAPLGFVAAMLTAAAAAAHRTVLIIHFGLIVVLAEGGGTGGRGSYIGGLCSTRIDANLNPPLLTAPDAAAESIDFRG
jgi:hypothetical protein